MSKMLRVGLGPWQETVINQMKIYTHRDINVVYDKPGTEILGKSAFCDYLRDHRLACLIPLTKNVGFMEHQVGIYYNSTFDQDPKVYVFDMEKAWDKKKMDFFWLFITRLKDGCAKNLYNEQIEVERPNIWIFTHRLPEKHMLPEGRLKVWEVIDGELSRYVPDWHGRTVSRHRAKPLYTN